MKRFCIILMFTVFCSTLYAIDKQPVDSNRSFFQLKGGVYVGGSFLIDGSDVFNYPNMLVGNGGLFLRLHLGKHWAIESGLDIYRTEKTFGSADVNQPTLNPTSTYSEYSVFAKGYAIPLNIQYHIQPIESNIRPFFALGFGYNNMSYMNNTRIVDYFNNDVIEYESVQPDNSILIQISQGLTFKLSEKLSLTELSYYKYLHAYGRNEVGMRLGICYDITD